MTINIKGQKWHIKKVGKENPNLEGNEGLCDTKTRTIYLSNEPRHRDFNNLFWHEYFHAFLHELCIRDLDIQFEHVIIEGLADLMERLDKNGSLQKRL